MRIDHAVIVVPDLEAGVALFRAAGFVVSPGGRHDEIPTANALIAFADGSYLELLACRDPVTRDELRSLQGTPRWAAHLAGVSAIARRFLPRLAGPEGVADLVLVQPRLARFAAESRRRGFVLTGPVRMRRTRSDGVDLEWEMLLPADEAVPMFIADRTPREHRVPATAGAQGHANGATGIAQVTVGCPDVPATALGLADLLGSAPRQRGDGRTSMSLDGCELVLEAAGRAGARAVAIAGSGPLPPAIGALGVRAG